MADAAICTRVLYELFIFAVFMPFFIRGSSSIFRPVSAPFINPAATNFYPNLQLNTIQPSNPPILTNIDTKLPEFKKAKTTQEADAYAKEKLHIAVYDMDKDLDTANLVNETLTEVQNRYKGKILMPAYIVNYSKQKHGQNSNGNGFYAAEYKYLAITSPQQKLDNAIQELAKPGNGKNMSSWFNNAAKNDFSQIEFINPKFQKEVYSELKKYREHPEKFSDKAKQELGIKIRKLTATNQLLSKRPLEVIRDLYNDDKNKAILKKEKFKSLADISKLTQTEQKEEFYKIVDKIKANNGNVYVDIDLMDKKAQKHFFLHEFGHFMHHTTKLRDNFNRGDEIQLSAQEQQIAAYVSEYAKTSPLEYVAEVYAGIMTGADYPQEVMALYKKFNGPDLQ